MSRRNSNGEELGPAPHDDRSYDQRQIAVRFVPKRACEGSVLIEHGEWRECPHPDCGVRVAADLIDHHRFGFAAACRLKPKAGAG